MFLILPLCSSALLWLHSDLLAGIGRLLLKAVSCAGSTSPVPSASPHWVNAPVSSHLGGSLLNLLQLVNVFIVLQAHNWMYCSRRELMSVGYRSIINTYGYVPIDTGQYVVSLQSINRTNLLLTKAKSR